MTDAATITDCTGACSPKGPRVSSCACARTKQLRTAKVLKIGAGFVALCALCCAVPATLIALGVIGVVTGAYLSSGLTTALIAPGVFGIGYLVVTRTKKKR